MGSLLVGSLFSGVGGLELGLERAGMQVRWQVEVDAFCQRVLAKHWPHVARHGDVREVGSHNLERVDIICGGFPCQDISNAGKRVGLGGARSGLWREYARVLGELRPRFALIENVARGRARWLGVVLEDLDALGYDAEWHCVPASAVGAWHERDRCFVVAHLEREPVRLQQGRGGREDGQGALLRGLPGEDRDAARTSAWASLPGMGGVVHGLPGRLDRLKALGNAVVPQVAELLGRRIQAHAEAA